MFKAFNDNWLCSICFECLLHPQRFPCGHHFCLDCSFPILENDRPCPICRAPIDKAEVVTDLTLLGEINDAYVFCAHKGFGCDSDIRLAEYNSHIDVCMSKPQKCQDCGYLASSLNCHTSRDCILNLKIVIDLKDADLKTANGLENQRRREVIKAFNEKDIAAVNATIAEREAQISQDALRASENALSVALDEKRLAIEQRDRMVDLTVEQDVNIKEYEEDILFYLRQNNIMQQSLNLKEAHIHHLERRLARYTGRPTPYGGVRPSRHIINISPEPQIVNPDRDIPSPAYSFSDAGDDSV